jgi:hypothetical protein
LDAGWIYSDLAAVADNLRPRPKRKIVVYLGSEADFSTGKWSVIRLSASEVTELRERAPAGVEVRE